MDTHQVAKTFSAGGRLSYEQDGYVDPLMALISDNYNGILLHPNPNLAPRVPVAFAEVLLRLGKVYPWKLVVTVAETWTKSFAPDDPTAEGVRQGDLSRMQEQGDPSIRTCVHTYVLDVKRPSDSYSVMATASNSVPVQWDIIDLAGQAQGDMPDLLMRAWMESLPPTPGIVMPPLALIAEVVAESGLATSALVMAPHWNLN